MAKKKSETKLDREVRANIEKLKSSPVEQRRGAPLGHEIWPDFYTTLIQGTLDKVHESECDLVTEKLEKAKMCALVKKDAGQDLFSGKLKPPKSDWALLIQLKGQPWLYFAASGGSQQLAAPLAQKTGLTTIVSGYNGTDSTMLLHLYEGTNESIGFQSMGYSREELEGAEDSDERKEVLSATWFKSDRHKKDWWQQFEDEASVVDALAKELDAYIPVISACEHRGKLSLDIFDDHGEVRTQDCVRIDLLDSGDWQKFQDFRLRVGV